MADIFLSYVRQDRERAKLLVRVLEDKGWSIWWDRALKTGETWHDVIEKELANARCVVVLWSARAAKSGWVRDEADEGRKRGILVPAVLEDRPPLGFRHFQTADLSDWTGQTDHAELRGLINAIDPGQDGLRRRLASTYLA